MLDEEQINKRIQEAADAYQPAYEDKAWKEMERLLDEHLPQKKDKRRIIFLLLILLIPVTGIYFGVQYKSARNTPVSQNTTLANQPGVPSDNNSKKADALNKINKISTGAAQNKRTYTSNLHSMKPKLSAELFFDKGNENKVTESMITNVEPKRSTGEPEDQTISNQSKENASSTSTDVTKAQAGNDIASGNEKPEKNKEITNKDSLNKNATHNKKTSGNRFAKNFSIGVTAGPDVSAVKLNNTGKVTLIKGVQVSYRLSDKFTLRSGFLIAKKIYNANASEYHSNTYGPPNYYLQTVDADCRVYEIPLTLSYNLSRSKKHEWFVSAGLSSYFMKKESYKYFYKYPSGYTDTKYYSVSDKNKHYFSMLDLSAGYEYTINKRISLAAEPYVKLPLTGIGIGKIKLSSAGVLFSLNIKPF